MIISKRLFTILLFLGILLFPFSANAFSPFGQESVVVDQASDETGDNDIVANEQVTDQNISDEDAIASDANAIQAEDSESFKKIVKILRKIAIRKNMKKLGKITKKAKVTEHHLSNFDDLKVSIDGDNYCGQFAMTTVLKGLGIEANGNDIYKQSNPAGIFTAPPVIVETLAQNGVKASKKQNASIDDIKKKIDSGKPVMVLVDSGSGVPHWICITGYDTDSSGKIVSVRMRDSYWGVREPHDMDIEKFKEAWAKPLGSGILGDIAKYKNLMIDIEGKTDSKSSPLYPSNFGTATEDNISSGLNDVVTGWKNGGVAQVTGGLTKLILGLPSAVLGVVSNFADSKGENLVKNGKENWKKGGFLNKLKGGAAIVGGGLLEGVGKVGKTIANVGSSVATVAGNAIKKIGSWFS